MIINVPGLNTTPSATEIAVSDEVQKLTGAENVDDALKNVPGLIDNALNYDVIYQTNAKGSVTYGSTGSSTKSTNKVLFTIGNIITEDIFAKYERFEVIIKAGSTIDRYFEDGYSAGPSNEAYIYLVYHSPSGSNYDIKRELLATQGGMSNGERTGIDRFVLPVDISFYGMKKLKSYEYEYVGSTYAYHTRRFIDDFPAESQLEIQTRGIYNKNLSIDYNLTIEVRGWKN